MGLSLGISDEISVGSCMERNVAIGVTVSLFFGMFVVKFYGI